MLRGGKGCLVRKKSGAWSSMGYGLLRLTLCVCWGVLYCSGLVSAESPADHDLAPADPRTPHARDRSIVEATRAYPLLSGPESLETIELAEGFRVELVASEPLVRDPVAFDWGPDGRLWVVEMADYPLPLEGNQPGGRIRILEDTTGDGRFDQARTFAENLSTPNSILHWRQGVLVTACPDILYLEDTTGDGRADRIEKLFSGFTEGNQQHRVNGLSWGLDNWVYVANGDSGGRVISHRTGQKLDIRGRDLRIRPDTGEMETQAGQTQFGRHRDDWGNWYSNNNPNPIFHFVLEEHYLRRNPHVVAPVVRRNILTGDTRVFPIGPIISHCDPQYRPIGATPRFTAACSTIVYRDDLFGPAYQEATFTSEPVYNIIHARRLIPEGVTFRSVKIQEQESEFFRSSDPWSRPTGLQVGPDGALYVADMVREAIEHPEWIDPVILKQIDVRSGEQHGRIYRILPRGVEPREVPRFQDLSTREWAEVLNSPSGWQRDFAQRKLLWSQDSTAVEPLVGLVVHANDPRTRLQALCTLDGLNGLTPELIRGVLQDPHPQVRRHALRLSEQYAASDQAWEADYRKLLSDSEPAVRLQLAYSVGALPGATGVDLLGQLIGAVQGDAYLLAAAFSSLSAENTGPILMQLASQPGSSAETLGKLAALATRYRDSRSVQQLIAQSPGNLRTLQVLRSWLLHLGAESFQMERYLDAACLAEWDQLQARFRQELPSAPLEHQELTLRILARRPQRQAEDMQLLSDYVDPRQPIQLQLAAVATLAETGRAEVPEMLSRDWEAHGPQLRGHVLELLLARPAWTRDLLKLLEQGTIAPAILTQSQRGQLQGHRDPGIQRRAEQLLGSITSDRDEVLKRYMTVEQMVFDGQRDLSTGRKLFGQKCAACHRLENQGVIVGPDLTTLVNRSPQALLTAILDPNRAVESRYLQYQVVTVDGRVLSGLLAEETANSVTLLAAEGKSTTLLRDAIEILKGSTLSMMPDGLEKDLTPTQLADLIYYVIHQTEPKKQQSQD